MFLRRSLSIFAVTAAITSVTEFKNHQLPLARIKKIMKSDEDVKVQIFRSSQTLNFQIHQRNLLEFVSHLELIRQLVIERV